MLTMHTLHKVLLRNKTLKATCCDWHRLLCFLEIFKYSLILVFRYLESNLSNILINENFPKILLKFSKSN